jgi:uncharacterized protein (TIGR00288 family)
VAEEEALKIAVYIDLENVALGSVESGLGKFDIKRVFSRLLDKGELVVRRAYADWSRFDDLRRQFYEAGVELLEMPSGRSSGKNSADIKIVVDVLELCYSKPHIEAFALVSGDSDFAPLVAKLRENGRRIIGVGVKSSASKRLIDSCDEFIYYDDLVRETKPKAPAKKTANLPGTVREAFDLLIEAATALQRENKKLHGSLVKETMKRKQPQFNEEYHGYNAFSKLLEDAERHGLIKLAKDERSGTYVIEEVLEEGR